MNNDDIKFILFVFYAQEIVEEKELFCMLYQITDGTLITAGEFYDENDLNSYLLEHRGKYLQITKDGVKTVESISPFMGRTGLN